MHSLPTWFLARGTSHGFAERALAFDAFSNGHQKVILQSDQELSIIEVQHKAGALIPTELVHEERRPVGDSISKGSVKRAHQTIQGQIRATKDFTDRQIGATIGLDSSVLKWLARRAAWTLTTFPLGGASKSRRSVSGYYSNHTGLRDHIRSSL